MASCRSGRIPLPSDPLVHAWLIHDVQFGIKLAVIGLFGQLGYFLYKISLPHRSITYKGPENPFGRCRHKRFPSGGPFFGWGNNGLNRDCNFKEYECWAGYSGKQWTF